LQLLIALEACMTFVGVLYLFVRNGASLHGVLACCIYFLNPPSILLPICAQGDSLVACSTCPRTFHAACCIPADAPAAGTGNSGASPWQCSMCRCLRCGSACQGPCKVPGSALATPGAHKEGRGPEACNDGVSLGLLRSIATLKVSLRVFGHVFWGEIR